MKKITILAGLLLFMMCLLAVGCGGSDAESAQSSQSEATQEASKEYTVTFYKDTAKKKVLEKQTVKQGGHPKEPAKEPAGYEENGFRYEFNGWYWNVDDAAMEFSLTDDDCEIWSDADIFPGFTQYLAKGYELIVEHEDGTDFITDTKTPISEQMKAFKEINNVYVQEAQEYEKGSGSDSND